MTQYQSYYKLFDLRPKSVATTNDFYFNFKFHTGKQLLNKGGNQGNTKYFYSDKPAVLEEFSPFVYKHAHTT